MFESLHNHTTASDGPVDHLSLLKIAERDGYGIMAFTDHDVLPPLSVLEKLKSDYRGPVKWLSGIEISSGLPKELGGGITSMFHILGLFVDPTNPALRRHAELATTARTERLVQMVANLRSIGFDITVQDCLDNAEDGSVSRRIIAHTLFKSPRYLEIMDRLKRQMAEEAKEDPEVAMAYMRMLDRPVSDHPFRLFLSDDAYLSDVYVDYLYGIDMDDSVRLIREAGGVAILAHWVTVEDKLPLDMVEGFLRDGRLDGLELRSSFEDDQQDGLEAKLRSVTERTGTVATYGTDGHSERVIDSFARHPVAGRTVGTTKIMLDKFKPSLKWTNFSQ